MTVGDVYNMSANYCYDENGSLNLLMIDNLLICAMFTQDLSGEKHYCLLRASTSWTSMITNDTFIEQIYPFEVKKWMTKFKSYWDSFSPIDASRSFVLLSLIALQTHMPTQSTTTSLVFKNVLSSKNTLSLSKYTHLKSRSGWTDLSLIETHSVQ